MILRAIYLAGAFQAPDLTWAYFAPVLITQVAINVALLAASITSVKPFLDSSFTGMLRADLSRYSTSEETTHVRKARLVHALDYLKRTRAAPDPEAEMSRLNTAQPPPAPPRKERELDEHRHHDATANGEPALPRLETAETREGAIRRTVEVDVYTSQK